MKKLFIAAIIFLIADPLRTEGASTQNNLSDFQAIRRIRIEVEQSYANAKGISLPFEEISTEFFKKSGVEITKNNYDAVLRINVKGKALSASYGASVIKPVAEKGEERIEYSPASDLYTGAEITGEILYEIPTKGKVIKKSFSGRLDPPIPYYYKEEDEKGYYQKMILKLETPEGAPFISVLKTGTGDFTYTMAKMIYEIYGPEALISVLHIEENRLGINAFYIQELGKPTVNHFIGILLDEKRSRHDRGYAAHVLREIKDPRAIEPLLKTLKNEDFWLQAVSEESLKEITGEDFEEDVAKWQEWWRKNKKRVLSGGKDADEKM